MSSAGRGTPEAPGADVQAAIATHFDGDASLYEAFAAVCADQFAADAAAGDKACAAADTAALRRLAHNLKSVLLVLGHADLSEQAGRIEQQAAGGDLNASCTRWRALRSALLHLQGPC